MSIDFSTSSSRNAMKDGQEAKLSRSVSVCNSVLPNNPTMGPWSHLPSSHPMAVAAALLNQSGPTDAGLPPNAAPSLPTPPIGSAVGPHSGIPPAMMSIAGGSSIMENWENWRQFQQAAYANNLDPHFLAFYHNSGCAMDLTNAPRRKNATRETTSMLKAWLNEHRKNPYPTKGEKIMLAIITKMTLTQVSTWFANARRRLKKENKMTWSPRNRSDEDHNRCGVAGHDSDADEDEDGEDKGSSLPVDDLDDFNEEDREAIKRFEATVNFAKSSSSGDFFEKNNQLNTIESEEPPSKKPKIWSIVDTASKSSSQPDKNTTESIDTYESNVKPFLTDMATFTKNFPMIPPLANRFPPHISNPGNRLFGHPGTSVPNLSGILSFSFRPPHGPSMPGMIPSHSNHLLKPSAGAPMPPECQPFALPPPPPLGNLLSDISPGSAAFAAMSAYLQNSLLFNQNIPGFPTNNSRTSTTTVHSNDAGFVSQGTIPRLPSESRKEDHIDLHENRGNKTSRISSPEQS